MSDNNKTKRVLKLIQLLSFAHGKSKLACLQHLQISDSSFYEYLHLLREVGFCIEIKYGLYKICYDDGESSAFQQAFQLSEEEALLLSKAIDSLDIRNARAVRLKHKMLRLFDHKESLEAYIQKEKSHIVMLLSKAIEQKKQVMLRSYASGNSQTIRNRIVEPFEFRDDFNLLWAFDNRLCENRQFKISRIGDVDVLPFSCENTAKHQSLPVDVFSNTGLLDKSVQIQMKLRAKNLLVEEYPLTEKWISKRNNDYFFETTVAKYEGPGRFVTGLPEDVKVLGDADFILFLKKKMKLIPKIIAQSGNSGLM